MSHRDPHTPDIVNNLWGPKEIRSIPCNLPAREHTELIGREAEMAHLLVLLSSRYGAHLISVDGIGGVGKTALVLEAAHQCWQASTGEVPNSKVPTFEAIIFASAKQQYLTPGGIVRRTEAQNTLCHIFRTVAHTLNHPKITEATPNDQPSRVRDALSHQRTLLIVDNLETMEDKQEIVSFLYELSPSVKVVITTRERALFSPICLEQLVEGAALSLIAKEAREKRVQVSKEQALALYQRIGGIPAALVYTIGQMASGYSAETVLHRLLQADGDVTRYCFEDSVKPLRRRQAHLLLMALAMFPRRPLRSAATHTAGLAGDPIAVEEGLAQLQRLSLVSQQGERYRMLPLTRGYALAELAAHPQFEQEARKRWVEWYLEFAKEYGGDDWAEWQIKYDHVEEEWENFLAVFDWCATHDQYNEMRDFWGAEGLLEFTTIYGHWNDRLTWLGWLIQEAERRGDWSTAVEAMGNKGYTLTMTSHLEEAALLLKRAWDLHEHAGLIVQAQIAQRTAILRIYQGEYTGADKWLKEATDILNRAQLNEVELSRYRIITQYYYGLKHYKKAHYYKKQEDFKKAESYFLEVIKQAEAIGWQRGPLYAQNWLAGIYIAHGRLDEAELLLQTGLTIAERNKDKRRIAHYKATFALLYLKRRYLVEARHWAQEALEIFEQLGMEPEIQEMHKLLKFPHG